MSRHIKSAVIRRLRSTIAESSQTASSCGISSCARGTRYIDLTDAIVSWRGRVNTLNEAEHYRKNLILRPSRRCPGKHVLYTCHVPKSWSAACVANRELIKLAQSRAHAIYADPVARAEWEPLYLEHKANPAPHPKPYSTIYHFIYNAIYQSLRAESLAARSVLIARASHLAQSIHPCSKVRRPVRAISMSASLPASHPILSIAPACHAGIAPVRRADDAVGISCISCASLRTGSADSIVSARSRPLIRLPIAA